ncbi:integral membrane protein 2A-like [Nerophis lumbriciformis]|uniref:integral membrane protein 2A-like n=1 Tax=Nerophis lumbriciformis TaxID=546530 RepID=UPI002AE05911|nr:integral membrane protein 2A-like [Nerophis lumbriciformis]XP_061901542.1 integral membrane protein 2A-like [Entelurus aequoreus]
MVKIAFNPALAQKALGKEPVAVKDPELGAAPIGIAGSTGRCLVTLLGIAFILSGLIVGGACLYRYFTPKRLYHGAMQFSDVSAGGDVESRPYYLPRVEEEVEISDSMAVISVPPPRFRAGDPAYILHDFNRKLTAYLDLTLRTCFVIPLNTSVVLPPQDLIDLFSQLMSGSYRSYLVHEDLVVTERIDDIKPLGFYIRRLCNGKDTYKMERRASLPGGGIHKRSAEECFTIHHFENKFVTETQICKA